ncbi:MAG TPA: ABC transporter permease [Haliangiales bacterium]|nr:ABC transporter permease [Haliangiales bacterium]
MGILHDARYGFRTMAKHPSFAAIAILTLGLAIGANTAIFSVVNAVLLQPLPYKDADRLVRIYTQFPTMSFDRFWLSRPEYFELRHDARSYSELAAYREGTVAIGGIDRPIRVPSAVTTHTLAPLLGVAPQLGRYFSAEEDVPGDPRAIVLGYDLWQRAFGGARDIVGKTITADAISVTVVGVMPKGFDFPGNGIEAWIPAGLDPADFHRGNHFLSVIGRLQPGVTVAGARAEMKSLVDGWQRLNAPMFHTLTHRFHPMVLHGLKAETVGSVQWALWLLQGAVLFVLLIACANVSNLLLARAEARAREIAIRAALGAGRRRLVGQFLTESLLLGLCGGAVGLVLAGWGVDLTTSIIPEGAPRAHEIHIDGWVLGFGIACSFATSLLFGLAPVLHTRVADLHERIKEGGQRTTAPRQRFRRALVVAEVAMAVVLVIGCGLVIRSFNRLQQVNVGFNPDGLLTMNVELPSKTYANNEAINAFWDRLLRDLGALPGVKSATLMDGLPPFREVNANDLWLEGKTRREDGPVWNTDFWNIVAENYHAAMGIKLVDGRLFTPADAAGAPPVVLVNEAFARKFYPGEHAIGKRIRTAGWLRDKPPQTIVGIVADVKQQGIDAPTGTEIYIPMRQSIDIADGAANRMNIALRADGVTPMSLASAARATIQNADPSLPVSDVKTMDQVLWSAVAKPRFLTFLMTLFAGLALVLAVVGVYGVMAYNVEQRTRELGIRVALGARPAGVRALVLRQGMFLVGIGVACGLGGALALNAALAHVFSQVLFETRALDPVTFILVGALVVVVAALACWVPALRATRIDPMIALRSE